ncbi:hypothetical protein CS8_091500 [Cupriavidus sp. 8B]
MSRRPGQTSHFRGFPYPEHYGCLRIARRASNFDVISAMKDPDSCCKTAATPTATALYLADEGAERRMAADSGLQLCAFGSDCEI